MTGKRVHVPSPVPAERLDLLNQAQPESQGSYVVYWMNAFRRASWNFALDRALEWAVCLRRSLLIFETLWSGRRWDSDRHHRFVLQGMKEKVQQFAHPGVCYYPYVEASAGEVREALVALAQQACLIVTDDFPIREHREELVAVARRVRRRLEAVDSNGLLPLRAAPQVFSMAHAFRRFLQKTLPDHLLQVPEDAPLAGVQLPPRLSLPDGFTRRWPKASGDLLAGKPTALGPLPIDHTIPAASLHGGSTAAARLWLDFLTKRLPHYPEGRNHPDDDATSGLSPYLHFGFLSTHQIFTELARHEGWSPARLADKPTGSREGWWGMSEAAEAFLDELVTWRELGFNHCVLSDNYDRYESLPNWAAKTLAAHTADRRAHVYSLKAFEQAETHDLLWNAAQRQLVQEGRIHNYLRMLWGKKILEWTARPQDALEVMVELNNKYALDGRDPNSYSGIFWVLGRYDRAWGPARPIFGTIRYMSSENTARKVRVKAYRDRFAR